MSEQGSTMIRVWVASKKQLEEIQAEFKAKHDVELTMPQVVARVLADRKPVTP